MHIAYIYVCIVEWYTRAVAVGGGSNMCAVRATSNQNCRTLCCVRVAAKWICVVVVVFYMHMYVYVYINTNVLSTCFKVCCVCCVYNAHRISTINFRCAPWFAAVYVWSADQYIAHIYGWPPRRRRPFSNGNIYAVVVFYMWMCIYAF